GERRAGRTTIPVRHHDADDPFCNLHDSCDLAASLHNGDRSIAHPILYAAADVHPDSRGNASRMADSSESGAAGWDHLRHARDLLAHLSSGNPYVRQASDAAGNHEVAEVRIREEMSSYRESQ